ncbi:MAG TPA: SPFH domain-containing protein [Aquimonas sp.]|nr:SPFH domain-containing protein [Aquimonas sp.]
MKENVLRTLPGIPMLFVSLILSLLTWWLISYSFDHHNWPPFWAGLACGVAALFLLPGLFSLEPNQNAVVSLFGKYVGTASETGLRWTLPFYGRHKVSMRVRNFESGKLKVNELEGSPIEIAAVIVWQVIDAAEARYNVEDFESFVHIQSEAALRAMATRYPYDSHDGRVALRSHPDEVSAQLKTDLDDRLGKAGVDVIEARISHLAYAPEIAQAMLQRQQADAVIAARTKIVEGAVGMVELALDQLKSRGVVELDPERRAAMVSNLLVVLCADRSTQPVVNAGSLY